MKNDFIFTKRVWLMPLILLFLMWSVHFIELHFGYNFNNYGIEPKSIVGLRGIIFSPFIHSGIDHLKSNSIPILVLTAATFYFYRKHAVLVLLYGVIASGLLTWLLGRSYTHHIGASGLVYVLAMFLLFKGLFTRYYRLVALSLSVVFFYGSLIWFVMPVKEGMSWEGHLSGFLIGLLFAIIIPNGKKQKNKIYAWQQDNYSELEDPFMQQFDSLGNFKPLQPDEFDEYSEYEITYHYKEEE